MDASVECGRKERRCAGSVLEDRFFLGALQQQQQSRQPSSWLVRIVEILQRVVGDHCGSGGGEPRGSPIMTCDRTQGVADGIIV